MRFQRTLIANVWLPIQDPSYAGKSLKLRGQFKMTFVTLDHMNADSFNAAAFDMPVLGLETKRTNKESCSRTSPDLLPIRCRTQLTTEFSAVRRAANAAIFLVLWLSIASTPLLAQIDADQVFSIPPGYLTRPLDQAKNALANEDYAAAVESLATLLGLDSNLEPNLQEDFLLPTRRKFATRSIRREASKLIANMPSRGRAVFELKYGIPAKKRLEEAIEANDRVKLMSVSRKYFHTKAGYVATYLLGKEKLFQGDFQFAKRYLEKLDQLEPARRSLDPELTLVSAIASAGSGNKDRAIEKLMSLKDDNPILQFVWGNEVKTHTLSDEESAIEFLDELVDIFPKAIVIPSSSDSPSSDDAKANFNNHEWLTSRSAQNQSVGVGDNILPIPHWSVRSVTGTKKDVYKRLLRERFQSSSSAFPVSHAIGLKNSIVFRTGDHLYSVNIDSGKRTWMYPWSHQDRSDKWNPQETTSEKQVSRKVWHESINGKLTSDGEKIYFVESNDFGIASRSPNPSFSAARSRLDPRNTLVALRVVDAEGFIVEGQIAWKIDTTNDDPDLSGAVFLGPPLLRDQTAYVLYERSGQIRVAGLDSETGKVIWSQQIASTQSHDGYDERLFRLRSSTTPFFVDGLLICPTMVGGLVAVDLTDLSLKWGFKYDPLKESRYIEGLDSLGPLSTWHDDGLFVLDDLICFSPVDSRQYFLLRIETGKTKVVRSKADNWFVAGKYKDMLVLVGPDTLTLDPVSGFSGFKLKYGEIGKPAGTGFFAGSNYYLPFSNRQLLKFDLEKRKIDGVVETALQLGNLSQYRGHLISRTPIGLEAYWLQKSASAIDKIASSDDESLDASAWLIRAQLQELQDQSKDAIASMIRSVKLSSTVHSQEYLSKLLINQINQGNSVDWEMSERGFKLLDNPENQRGYLLARIESRFAAGEGTKAIQDLIKLIDLYGPEFSGDEKPISLSSQHSVAGLRLVRARIRNAINSLPLKDRSALIDQLRSRYDSALAMGRLSHVRTLTEICGSFDFVADRIDPFLRTVMTSKKRIDLIWAESLLLEILERDLANNTDNISRKLEIIQGLVTLKTSIYEATDVYSQSLLRDSLRSLKRRLSAKEFDPSSKQHKQASLRINSILKKMGAPPVTDMTPDGLTRIGLSQDSDVDLLFVDAQERRHRSQLLISRRLAELTFRIEFDDRGYFLIRDQSGKLVFQDVSRARGSRHSNYRFDQTSYQILGDLLILSCGYDHIAMDISRVASLQPEDGLLDDSELLEGEKSESEVSVLWRFNAYQSPSSNGTTRMRRESNSIGFVSKELFDSNGARVCKTCFLSSTGHCFLSGDTVYCLDPWTGRISWKRSGIASGSDLVGDENHVYVLSPDDRKIEAFDKLDGSPKQSYEIPANMINRFAQFGSMVFSLRSDNDSVFIYGFHLQPEKAKLVWTQEIAKGTQADLVNSHTLATLSPDGLFQLTDLGSGRVKTKFQLELQHRLSSIQMLEMGNDYLLVANQNSNSRIESKRTEIGSQSRQVINVEGSVMLLNDEGAIWSGPALIDDFDLVLNQPSITPLVLLKKIDRKSGTTELIFLRRSDGSLVRFNKPIEHLGVTTNIRYLKDKKSVSFNMGYHWMALKLTNTSRPPEPPARTGKYSSRIVPPQKPTKAPQRDPFLESDEDPFSSKGKVIKEWIAEEWKNNPLNPVRKTETQSK